ncbi:beta-ketoacyl-ACP synthase, partial [Rhizobium ruizarguesonis]
MSQAANDVVISGLGIVTCQGVGKEAHIALISATSVPKAIVETEKFQPYPVYP